MNVAELLRRSIFTQAGRVSFGGAVAAYTQFLLGVRGVWHGRLRIAPGVFTWADPQRKGLAEQLGLVMATVAADRRGWDGRGPQWADLDSQYWGATNNRPDLVFDLVAGGQMLGEARGRFGRKPAVLAPPSQLHKDWIAELESWHEDVEVKWMLAATWATDQEIVIDSYDPGEPTQLLPEGLLEAAIRSREAQLSSSAPDAFIEFDQRRLRGAWVVVPSLPGDEESTSFFLGVVNPPLSDAVLRDSDILQVAGVGSVVVVLTRTDVRDSLNLDVARAHLVGAEPQLARIVDLVVGGTKVRAVGFIEGNQVTIFAGSTARSAVKRSLGPSGRRTRSRLRREGALVEEARGVLRFAQDCEFSSPSAAAEQVLGTAVNGWKAWTIRASWLPIDSLRHTSPGQGASS